MHREIAGKLTGRWTKWISLAFCSLRHRPDVEMEALRDEDRALVG